MVEFNQKQINDLKGSHTLIARSCGVSPEYVRLIIGGLRKQNSETAVKIAKKAKSIIEILES